jgi:hypothetical protein
MLGCCAEKQERQPMALGIHSRVIQLLAYSFQAAEVVVLAEQSLEQAALLGIGDRHNLDLFQNYLSSLWGLAQRRFLSFHVVDGKKFNCKCPAKSALAPLFLLQTTFMHTRWL